MKVLRITGALSPLLLTAASMNNGDSAFSNSPRPRQAHRSSYRYQPTKLMSTTALVSESDTELSVHVSKLKRVLEQEYISFFNPMIDSWYAQDVTFNDPMTSLSGVDSYRNNVDMLAGRTLMGRILFDGAGINLHSVTGGEVVEDSNGKEKIEDIITRWTLKVTAKVLPWKPEAVFSGVSVYKVQPGGRQGMKSYEIKTFIIRCEVTQSTQFFPLALNKDLLLLGKLITGTPSISNQIHHHYHLYNNMKKFRHQ